MPKEAAREDAGRDIETTPVKTGVSDETDAGEITTPKPRYQTVT